MLTYPFWSMARGRGVHPSGLVDRFGGLLGIVPVAAHDAVASGAQLAGCVALDALAGGGVDDLYLDVGMYPPDRRGAVIDVVIGSGLGRYGRGFSHAVADRYLAHVHLIDHSAHDLDRARGAGHDSRSQ